MNSLSLAWQTFRQQSLQPELHLIAGTLCLLTSFLLCLSLTGESVQLHLEKNLQSMLGSDMVIEQYSPMSQEERAFITSHAQAVTQTRLLDINLGNGPRWQRAQLKLVASDYPLQGTLSVSSSPGAPGESRHQPPAVGEIWVGSRLFSALDLTLGQSLEIAGTQLVVSGVAVHEPDRLLEGHSTAMRALVHEDSVDLQRAGADAFRYRTLIEAGTAGRESITSWAADTLPDAELLNRHEGEHPLSAFWVRIENFFGLSSVLLFLIAAMAVHLAGRRRLAALQHRLAIYASLGVTARGNTQMALVEWLLLLMSSMLPALGLGYLLQWVVVSELQNYFPGISAGLHPAVFLKTIGLVFVLFLCLQAPALIALSKSSVMTLIRGVTTTPQVVTQIIWNVATLSVLTGFYSDNWLLTGMVLAALASAVCVIAMLTGLTLWGGERLFRSSAGIWPFALFIMRSRLASKTFQIMGLGLCATLVLFTLMLMKDIGDAMFSQTRTNNGNLVVSEALADQLPGLEAWAESTGAEIRDMRLYHKAVLTGINGLNPEAFAGHPSESLSVLQTPIRLSWAASVPENNRIARGQWWEEGTSDWQQVSVESEVMSDLGLSLGDELVFQAGDRDLPLTIVATHDFVPGGSSVTFWFVAPPALANALTGPVRAMGSMELPDSAWSELGTLLQQFPTLAVVSLKELTRRFDDTLAVVTHLTMAYSIMVLLLSVAVLVASMVSYQEDDRRRIGLLKSLGLNRLAGLRLALYEWLATGILAGTGAVCGVWLAGQLIYRSQFQMSYQPDMGWILGALGITCSLVASLALLFTRSVLRTPVRALMTG